MNEILKKLELLNVDPGYFIPYGFDKGKLDISLLDKLKDKKSGKLILVTAINPTKAGEGKTTVSIGLADGINSLGESAMLALREPSLGPVFGMKGGATGGGKSSIVPEMDINLHFTGDFHAITSAHNLLSALIDNHIYYEKSPKITTVIWPRTLDVNDRFLRSIETKLRKDKFIITAASEIMAILALSVSVNDLKERLNNILIGFDPNNNPIFVKDLKVVNSLVLLLKDAINPNVVLTKEGNLALVHAGPFANIAHGSNSVLATKMALKLSNYVVTEAGFGADLGMEKFLDLKMRTLDEKVSLVVLVVTTNSLKSHGYAADFTKPNMEALKRGISHLEKHIENIKSFNLDFVVAVNKHKENDENEIKYLLDYLKNKGYSASLSDGYTNGSLGTIDLSELVIKKINASLDTELKRPYDLTDSSIDKIKSVCMKIYGAKDVIFTKNALSDLEKYEELIKGLPVCIAKTPLSFSDDSENLGVPKDFLITIKEIRPQLGAGFFVALTKGINVMPGLNKDANAYNI